MVGEVVAVDDNQSRDLVDVVVTSFDGPELSQGETITIRVFDRSDLLDVGISYNIPLTPERSLSNDYAWSANLGGSRCCLHPEDKITRLDGQPINDGFLPSIDGAIRIGLLIAAGLVAVVVVTGLATAISNARGNEL